MRMALILAKPSRLPRLRKSHMKMKAKSKSGQSRMVTAAIVEYSKSIASRVTSVGTISKPSRLSRK